MNARTELAEALTPLLPSGWVIVPTVRGIDRMTVPHLIINASRIAPGSTSGALLTTFGITIVEPKTDVDAAESALDDEVAEFLTALLALTWCHWESASKQVYEERHLAWTFDLETITNFIDSEEE